MEFIQILLIVTLVTNGILLLLIFALYQNQRNIMNVGPFFDQISKLRAKAARKESRILKEALDKSKDAVKQSLNRMRSVEDLSEDTKRSLNNKAERLVSESVSKHNEVFQKIMNKISDSYKNQLWNLAASQNEEYIRVLDGVKSSANQEIQRLSEETSRITQEERKRMEEELATYKKRLTEDVDQRIFQVVSEVARETIGEAIDIEKHQELVMKALERAKQEKFI